jgi:hypothetical protein
MFVEFRWPTVLRGEDIEASDIKVGMFIFSPILAQAELWKSRPDGSYRSWSHPIGSWF